MFFPLLPKFTEKNPTKSVFSVFELDHRSFTMGQFFWVALGHLIQLDIKNEFKDIQLLDTGKLNKRSITSNFILKACQISINKMMFFKEIYSGFQIFYIVPLRILSSYKSILNKRPSMFRIYMLVAGRVYSTLKFSKLRKCIRRDWLRYLSETHINVQPWRHRISSATSKELDLKSWVIFSQAWKKELLLAILKISHQMGTK